ncbi:tyrosine-type recombinase/integrase [Runella sp. MFBS21]|uniref:tyrosine-type recombinase/integrase n=1 Tax=Runella sp. MFBS21 TaxID=3034018 RepID=UPI0023F6BF2C|nr:tyrosine-type recombinase/integrase [Runella sp. MFBS21]MDF7821409.1 tyrosine-type recombinase/integrase [Runella sp. MFBS21]
MMIKQDIHSLVEACVAWLRGEGYSETRIQDYLRLWKSGIKKFMEEHSLAFYSTEVGARFINSPLPFDSATYKRAVRRSVAVLSDFLLNGKVSRRIVHRVNYELPGEIGDAAKAFIASREELRLSMLTLSEHRRVLSYFIQHLSMKSIHQVSGINEQHVLSFLASSQNCKDKFLNTTRLFFRYLYACKLVDRNIEYVIGRNNFLQREKLPSVYDADEIRQIEGAVDRSDPVGKRDYAMLLLATRLGLRSSDIAGLQFTNLDWDNNLIRLTQYKTKREVELPLLANIGDAIINYLQYARPVSPLQNVFLSACAPYRMTNRLIINGAISRIIKASKVVVGNRKFGPHSMRHTLASRLLGNGISLPIISETLGHTDTQTTMKYLRIDINNLRRCALEVPMVGQGFYKQKGGVFYE